MNKYELECVDGGWGWGVTGQKAEMCAETEEFIKNNIPGGWIYKCLGPTKDTFYLRHIFSK